MRRATLVLVFLLLAALAAPLLAGPAGKIERGSVAASRIAAARADKAQSLLRHPKAVGKLRGPLLDVMDTQVRIGSQKAIERATALGVSAPGGSAVLVGVPAAGVSAGDLAGEMTKKGARVIRSGSGYVKASVPLSILETLADNVPQLGYLYVPVRPKLLNTVVSEGVANGTGMNAADWHARGIQGDGVKVAIIDPGFEGLASLKAADELPASAVEVDFGGSGMETGGEHGCACAEIVYDMAPHAQLYLLRIDDNTDLLEAENYCKANGIKIISSSLGWDTFNFYDGMGYSSAQPSPVTIADDASANGILFVNSAGNERRSHALTTWNDPDSDNILDWSSAGANINEIGYLTEGWPVVLFLTWNAWPTTDQDFDFYLIYWNGSSWETVIASENWQTGTQPPVEYLGYTVPSDKQGYYGFVIVKYSANTSPTFIARSWYEDLYYSGYNTPMDTAVAPGSIGCPADAASVMAVGAIDWLNYRTGPIEEFSSIGPNNRAYTGGTALVKPDICGPDFVSTVTYGVEEFGGTSAAAPHLAGAAALVWQANPSFTNAQVRQYLETSGDNPDLGAPGKDNEFGAGPCVLEMVTYLISGHVRGSGGNGIDGATMTATNGGGTTLTNSSGYYELAVPSGWSGTVTPSKTGFTFSPASRPYANVTTDQTSQDFGVATGFTEVPTGIPAIRGGMVWGDYDSDGDLDVAMVGNDTALWYGRIYRNDAGTFHDIGAPLPIMSGATCAWCDYDSDGDLDLAISGAMAPSGRCTRVYRNNGGDNFQDIGAPLLALESGDIAWGDYNNDGYADLAVCGRTSECGGPSCVYTKLYRNVPGVGGQRTFADSGIGFTGVTDGSVISWADYDNDGDLDLTVMGAWGGGTGRGGYIGKLYRNNGNETFTETAAPIPAGNYGSMDWGDYDKDGDLDLAISGGYWDTSLIWQPYTQVLRNDSGTLVDAQAPLVQLSGEVAWGDYDDDGDMDLVVSGAAGAHGQGQPPPGGLVAELYVNNNNAFASSGLSLAGCSNGSARFGDFDNDGDMDLLLHGWNGSADILKLYRNERAFANTPPAAPTGLLATVNGSDITFNWSAATDAETAAPGLSYNLRVGTSPGDDDVFCGMASLSTGLRRIPAIGNAQKRLSWTLKGLTAAHYYWSVQAIDSAYAGSPWAAESVAGVPNNDNFADAAPISGASGQVTGSNTGASKEPGEPDHAGTAGGHSVWWRWTAPASGPVSFNTIGSSFDTLLAVYTGPAVNSLTRVVADDDCNVGVRSRVTFVAAAGTTYHIAADGYGGSSGSIVLSWGPCVPPANDDFANAQLIPLDGGQIPGSSVYATKEPGEPDHFGNFGGASVWYRWTASRNGKVRAQGYQLLAVYTGSSVGALTLVAADYGDLQFTATAGTTYHIAVDGINGYSSDFTLGLQQGMTVAEAKSQPDGTDVCIADAIVSGVWSWSYDSYYIESEDRTAGIRVYDSYLDPIAGDRVDVSGTIRTDAETTERYVEGNGMVVGTGSVKPLGMPNRSVGGGDGVGQVGLIGGVGLNTIGLLVRTCGRVTYAGEYAMYIDDGTNDQWPSVHVSWYGGGYDTNDYVCVTGVVHRGADLFPTIYATEPPVVVYEFPP